MTELTSRLPGFYQRPLQERLDLLEQVADFAEADRRAFQQGGIDLTQADHMIENAVGLFSLPLGVATNFTIDGRDVLIPMAIEEPSVLAAVSNAARLFRLAGGFRTFADAPVMIAQVQLLDVPDVAQAVRAIEDARAEIVAGINGSGGSIVQAGGGALDLQCRVLNETTVGPMLIVHLLYDVRDAMGANVVNTAAEQIAPRLEALSGGRALLRILSNLTDERKAGAAGAIPADALATETMTGEEVVRGIVEAGAFAEADPYRAATHNKGIMNGIDAVVIATGNDWRAVEAGAHAYAARSGRYTSLTRWTRTDAGDLRGEIELPLALGIVGGATRVHPGAQAALRLMRITSASELARIAAAVGLAQNLAAIRALATEGIQRGHMRMHARQIAMAAGASDAQIQQVVDIMIRERKIRPERARTIVESLKG